MENAQVKLLVDDTEICLSPIPMLPEIQATYGNGVLLNNQDGSYFVKRDISIPAGNYTFVRIATSSELTMGDRLGGIENRLGAIEHEVKDRLGGIENRLGGIENRQGGIENRLGGIENRQGEVENRLGAIEHEVKDRLGAIEHEVKDRLGAIEHEVKESREEREYEKGRYFVRMDALWIAEHENFGGSEAKLRGFRTKDSQIVAWYKQLESDGAPKKKSDFPQEPMFPGSKEKNNDRPSLAHLLPKDRSCTMFYGNAVALITGYSCNENEKNCLASNPLRHFIEGSSNTGKVGIKNSPGNYLHLPGNHASYFDHLSKGNGLIITPIWDPAVKWCSGTTYEVLVVAVQASTYMWMGLDPKAMDEKEWLAKASDKDCEKATDFLKLMVKTLADQLDSKEGDAFFKKASEMKQNELELLFANQTGNSQTSEGSGSGNGAPPRPAPPVSRSNSLVSSTDGDKPSKKVEEFKNKLNDLRNVRDTLRKTGTVAVPKMKNTEDDGANNSMRVLKVNFARYFLDKEKSIPDPHLVALRAAICWSSLQDTKLLPACSCALVTEGEPAHSNLPIEEIICTLTYDDDDCSVLSEEKLSVSTAVVSPDSTTANKMNFW
jgi:hypothetical protein